MRPSDRNRYRYLLIWRAKPPRSLARLLCRKFMIPLSLTEPVKSCPDSYELIPGLRTLGVEVAIVIYHLTAAATHARNSFSLSQRLINIAVRSGRGHTLG